MKKGCKCGAACLAVLAGAEEINFLVNSLCTGNSVGMLQECSTERRPNQIDHCATVCRFRYRYDGTGCLTDIGSLLSDKSSQS